MSSAKTSYHHGDLRAALLKAALDVIAELGPRGLTIREVARRAGVSHAAPYRHFTDKDELIQAVVEQGFELMQQTMVSRKAEAGDDPLAQFAASGSAYVEFAWSYPAYYRIMFSGDLLSTTGQESLQHTSSEAFKQMVADVEMCQRLGVVEAGDPLIRAIAIWSTVHGFVTLANDNRIAYLIGDNYTLEQLQEFVLGAIFTGLAPKQQ